MDKGSPGEFGNLLVVLNVDGSSPSGHPKVIPCKSATYRDFCFVTSIMLLAYFYVKIAAKSPQIIKIGAKSAQNRCKKPPTYLEGTSAADEERELEYTRLHVFATELALLTFVATRHSPSELGSALIAPKVPNLGAWRSSRDYWCRSLG